jgi:hypothetical protein
VAGQKRSKGGTRSRPQGTVGSRRERVNEARQRRQQEQQKRGTGRQRRRNSLRAALPAPGLQSRSAILMDAILKCDFIFIARRCSMKP